jgi:hypothetical protein
MPGCPACGRSTALWRAASAGCRERRPDHRPPLPDASRAAPARLQGRPDQGGGGAAQGNARWMRGGGGLRDLKGGRYLEYRPGGRYLKYRPPPGYISAVRSYLRVPDEAHRLPRQAWQPEAAAVCRLTAQEKQSGGSHGLRAAPWRDLGRNVFAQTPRLLGLPAWLALVLLRWSHWALKQAE